MHLHWRIFKFNFTRQHRKTSLKKKNMSVCKKCSYYFHSSVSWQRCTSGVYIFPSSSSVNTQLLPLIKGFTFSLMLMSNKYPVSPEVPPIISAPLTSSRYNLAVTAQAGVCEAVRGWDRLVSFNRRSAEPRCRTAVITTLQVRQVEHLRCF